MSLHEVGKKTKLKKKLKKTSLAVTSRRIVGSYPGEYSGGLCRRSNRPPSSTLYRITFWVEAIHSFLTFTVGTPPPPTPKYPPFSEASWLPVCAEAPPATLEKPGASDLH